MKALDCVQRSEAWRLARCGRLTASRAADILARARRPGEESISRRTYRQQLIGEQLTGIPLDRPFRSAAMRRGCDQEPAARAAYAARTGLVVHTSGLLVHDVLKAGCSVDGHVGGFDEGLLEIKNPNTATHLLYLVTRQVPARYRAQITHHVWLTGARWCDFVSYDARLPARLRLVIVRLERAHLDIAGYDREARRFLAEVDAAVAPLAGLAPVAFFRAAPLALAREVLTLCANTVRRRTQPAGWSPRLVRAS